MFTSRPIKIKTVKNYVYLVSTNSISFYNFVINILCLLGTIQPRFLT